MNKEKPNILAFDTAMSGISIGMTNKDGQSAQRVMETQRGQAAHLVPLIQECLEEINISFQNLDLIGVTRGPGSFTGLRIGLTTARTLGLSLEIPVIGLNTLDLMARHADSDENILVVLETKRIDFYARLYDANKSPMTEPIASDAASIIQRTNNEPFMLVSDCLDRFETEINIVISNTYTKPQPEPSKMVQMTHDLFISGEKTSDKPLYLRGADVSQPKVKPRQLKKA